MKYIKILSLFLLTFYWPVHAQEQLNNYKYIVVPQQFEFQKEPGQYRVNGLTKFLLEKQNFTVLMDTDNLPDDAAKNNCLVLKTNVIDDSSLFKTKLTFQFKDCQGNVVYTSTEGSSREKKYLVAYNEAVREALSSLANFKHTYQVKEDDNQVEEVIVTPLPKVKEVQDVVVADEKEVEEEIEAEVEVVTSTSKETSANSKTDVLKAEPFDVINYRLKNETGETVYTILYSGKEDLYIVKGKDAVIYKINNNWVIVTNTNGTLQMKSINIRF